ncbi:Uu.00g054610.m01.CDS01 [Anthostomella pinea]|uniref:Uu.00g054610.m01.CDS01 n=1 Tax=Anthostomella pinea TaxID=933095 RepID=A0AAI8VQY2_9PEZI|nr:Uu.00g054610.m01.CDS01 [Anthostomella pinea]
MGLSKVAIITTAKKEPGVVIRNNTGYHAITALAPTLHLAVRCQHMLSAALLTLLLQACLLASTASHAGRVVAAHIFLASMSVLHKSGVPCSRVGRTLWRTPSMRKLRKKLEFEFFTSILGSGGNNFCLVLFWPGWWMIMAIGLTIPAFVG